MFSLTVAKRLAATVNRHMFRTGLVGSSRALDDLLKHHIEHNGHYMQEPEQDLRKYAMWLSDYWGYDPYPYTGGGAQAFRDALGKKKIDRLHKQGIHVVVNPFTDHYLQVMLTTPGSETVTYNWTVEQAAEFVEPFIGYAKGGVLPKVEHLAGANQEGDPVPILLPKLDKVDGWAESVIYDRGKLVRDQYGRTFVVYPHGPKTVTVHKSRSVGWSEVALHFRRELESQIDPIERDRWLFGSWPTLRKPEMNPAFAEPYRAPTPENTMRISGYDLGNDRIKKAFLWNHEKQQSAKDMDDYAAAMSYAFAALSKSEKETTMQDLNIRTITYIGNREASSYSDDEIYNLIKTREAKLKGYTEMTTKPERLKATMDAIQAEIDQLVAIVDARGK